MKLKDGFFFIYEKNLLSQAFRWVNHSLWLRKVIGRPLPFFWPLNAALITKFFLWFKNNKLLSSGVQVQVCLLHKPALMTTSVISLLWWATRASINSFGKPSEVKILWGAGMGSEEVWTPRWWEGLRANPTLSLPSPQEFTVYLKDTPRGHVYHSRSAGWMQNRDAACW